MSTAAATSEVQGDGKKVINQSRYGEILDVMNDKVEKAIIDNGHAEALVFYSAYELDEDNLPIDNLDEVALHGDVTFVREVDTYWGGGGKGYKSKKVHDPTWLECAVMANEMIEAIFDRHHIYFEGVGVDENGLGYFLMGA